MRDWLWLEVALSTLPAQERRLKRIQKRLGTAMDWQSSAQDLFEAAQLFFALKTAASLSEGAKMALLGVVEGDSYLVDEHLLAALSPPSMLPETAAASLRDKINAHLDSSCFHLRLNFDITGYHRDYEVPVVRFETEDLIAQLWRDLALAWTGGGLVLLCRHCERVYSPKKMPSLFCGGSCRSMHHRKRKKEGAK